MSTLNVDKVDPSTGTALEIGSSGDTITVPSGATFAVSGTMNASSITAGTLAEARGGTGTTSYSPGITNAQCFRLTTSFTGGADPIASNWEECDTNGYGALGSGVSQSSGLFSFAATGIYLVQFYSEWTLDGDDRQVMHEIQVTLNNSTYTLAAESRNFIQQTSSAVTMISGASNIQLDVTDVSNIKVAFATAVINSSTEMQGRTDQNRTYAQFIRIGDT